jgi:long-chain fatty acid transport protein
MRCLLLAGVAIGLMAASPSASADSFALNEYSARGLGLATAGRTTMTDDASSAFGNPALLVRLHHRMATGAISGVLGTAQFDDIGSHDLLGRPLGSDTRGILEEALIPALNIAWPLNDRMALGLAVSAPFGLATKYETDWPGRYQALKSSLRTIDINPSFSWQATDTLSLGAGVSAQYAEATLSSAIDFGAVCFGAIGPAGCANLGLVPQAADGRVEVQGDDWSWGYNVGLAWTPAADWMIGLTYRSGVDHTLEGEGKFFVPDNALLLTAGGAFTDSAGTAKLDLPAAAEVGAKWQASSRLSLYASAQWKQWSDLEELRIDFANPVQPDSAEQLNYQDSWRYSVGAEYAIEPQWTLRAGFALDQSPTQADFRTARIPDNDRQVYALGASWAPSEIWTVDMAYNRIEIDDTAFDHTGSFGDRVTGLYSGHANIVSVGLTRRF